MLKPRLDGTCLPMVSGDMSHHFSNSTFSFLLQKDETISSQSTSLVRDTHAGDAFACANLGRLWKEKPDWDHRFWEHVSFYQTRVFKGSPLLTHSHMIDSATISQTHLKQKMPYRPSRSEKSTKTRDKDH